MPNNKTYNFRVFEQIFTNISNYTAIYFTALSIFLFIAGGDGLYISLLTIIFALLFFLIKKWDAQFIFLINKVYVQGNIIRIKYFYKNQPKIECFNTKESKITVNTTIMTTERKTSIFLILNIEKEDGTFLMLQDRSNDIDHSLRLLKFFKDLNLPPIDIELDPFEISASDIAFKNAVDNYLNYGVYNKKIFKYYERIFLNIIAVTTILAVCLMTSFIVTALGLDSIHLTNFFSS